MQKQGVVVDIHALFVKRQHRLVRPIVRIRFVFITVQQTRALAAVMLVYKFRAGIFQPYAFDQTGITFPRLRIRYEIKPVAEIASRIHTAPAAKFSCFVGTVILPFRHIADVVTLFGILKHAA